MIGRTSIERKLLTTGDLGTRDFDSRYGVSGVDSKSTGISRCQKSSILCEKRDRIFSDITHPKRCKMNRSNLDGSLLCVSIIINGLNLPVIPLLVRITIYPPTIEPYPILTIRLDRLRTIKKERVSQKDMITNFWGIGRIGISCWRYIA